MWLRKPQDTIEFDFDFDLCLRPTAGIVLLEGKEEAIYPLGILHEDGRHEP